MIAPIPPNEEARLKALRLYEILDTEPEQDFDDLTLLAAHICGTPIATITLIDETRQWFKSKVGLTDLLIVEDARGDTRFADNPLVTGEPRIRFYVGAPLISPDGQALGTLCVIDRVPHQTTAAQTTALQALSRQVVAQLELRRNLRELRRSEERFSGAFEAAASATAPDEHRFAHAPTTTSTLQTMAGNSSTRALPTFSREKLLDQLDGDEALMQRLIALFQENTPRLLDDIRGSIARRGSTEMARSAHALRSSLGAFGANDARRLTQQLEAQASHENYEDTDRTFAALERETAEIHVTLTGFTPARA